MVDCKRKVSANFVFFAKSFLISKFSQILLYKFCQLSQLRGRVWEVFCMKLRKELKNLCRQKVSENFRLHGFFLKKKSKIGHFAYRPVLSCFFLQVWWDLPKLLTLIANFSQLSLARLVIVSQKKNLIFTSKIFRCFKQ